MKRNRVTLKSAVSIVVVLCGLTSELNAAGPLELVEAIKRQDHAAIVHLITPEAANVVMADGTTPLHWASYVEDTQTAQALLKVGARQVPNRHGVTPLALAALNGNASLIRLLIANGASANTMIPGGETVLMTAARTGRLDAVTLLLEQGADVNAVETSRQQSALMWAAGEGYTPVVEKLLTSGARLDARSTGGFTAFLFAVRQGHIDTVKALLQSGADANETTVRPSSFTRTAVPGYALGQRPQGSTSALVLAVGSGHFELASMLLDAGANPNASQQGWTALHELTWARKCGQGDNNPCPAVTGSIDGLELARRLVAHGADVNARMTQRAPMGTTELGNVGATPFLLAARTADAPLLRELHRLGADPLLPNDEGTTPLMAAAGCGTYSPGEDPGTDGEALEVVKITVELGGDLNTVDSKGDTAMHGAAYKFLPSVVRFLAETGARPDVWNQKNKLGFTPLTIAEGILRAPTGVGDHVRLSLETATAIKQVLDPAERAASHGQ